MRVTSSPVIASSMIRFSGNTASRLHRVGQAELLEHPEHVGTELDAGADLLELGRLLDHLAADAFTRQRQRRRHAANAAADDENRQPISLARHGKPRKFNPFGNDP